MSLQTFLDDVGSALKGTGQSVSNAEASITTASRTLAVSQVLTVILLVVIVILLARRK